MPVQYFRPHLDFLCRAFLRDVAVIDDVDAACQRERRSQILLHKYDGLSGFREIAAGFDEIALDHWRETFERFVEQMI